MPIPSNNAKRVKIYHESHSDNLGGTVYCTGTGDMGQLGLGEDLLKAKKLTKVPNIPTNVIQVVAGGVHSACLTQDGKVFTWGCNDDGALGRLSDEDSGNISEYDAGQVTGELINYKIIQISCGDSHTCALTDDGLVFIWGTFRNANGRIGLIKENRTERFPIRLYLRDPKERIVVTKIASGADHVCCLCSDGRLFIFGNWEQGQLGRNYLEEILEEFSDTGDQQVLNETQDSYFELDKHFEETPENCLEIYLKPYAVSISNYLKFDHVWTGTYCTFARIKRTKQVLACGLNNYKQLNIDIKTKNMSDNESLVVRDLTPWKGIRPECVSNRELYNLNAPYVVNSIAAGEHHTLIGCTNGTLFSIGRHDYGRLGLGELGEDPSIPIINPVFNGITRKLLKVATGPATVLAISTDNELFGWGMADNNQIPGQSKKDLYEPTLIPVNGQVLDCSVGAQHAIILVRN